MIKPIKHIIAFIAAMIITLPLYALSTDSTYTVSIITCGPGNIIYELEGHSGLRIKGPDTDIVVHWGLFDFDSPNFVYRYVKGETDYSVGTVPYEYFVRPYIATGREVVEQQLNLSPQQALKVIESINTNLKPENRIYRYNYVKDNCSTRPFNIIKSVLRTDTITLGSIHEFNGEQQTYRSIMRRCHKNYPWYQFGIDLALGSGIDYKISSEEMTFAPILLKQLLAGATVTDSAGNIVPLIKETITINPELPEGAIDAPTPWYATPLACSCGLLILTMLISIRDIYSRSISRWFDFILYLIYGLAGCLITFLVFFSVHEATSPNWLILWLNPLCLLVPAFIWLKKFKNVLLCYQFANFAALITLAAIWGFTNQSGNIAFIPLVMCDLIRSLNYIYLIRCDKKRKRLYRVTYSQPFSSPWQASGR